MTDRKSQLEAAFIRIGVTELKPGFYDDPAFMAAERINPSLLNEYAEYCLEISKDAAYLSRARGVVQRVVAFLYPLTVADNSAGQCMPTSLLVSRFLEAEGIWNFVVKGGVIVWFPGLAPKVMEPQDAKGGTYGHSWVVAPPFEIVDLTISRQHYAPDQQREIDGYLLSELAAPEDPYPFPQGEPEITIRSRFRPIKTELGYVSISYVPYGIGGPEESFETMRKPILRGLSPFELYKRFAES